MAPRPRRRTTTFDPERANPAAVLVLLFPAEPGERALGGGVRPGDPCLILTRRTAHVAAHKGEICLPGGALDPGESAVDAALREAEEEIGVARREMRVLGQLTPVFIPVSGFRLEPFVAAAAQRPAFKPAAREVDALIEVPLDRLRDHSARIERHITRDGEPVVIPTFDLPGAQVWGATAMILSELSALLSELEVPA